MKLAETVCSVAPCGGGVLVPRHTSLLSGAAELGRAGDVAGAGEGGGHHAGKAGW